MDRKIGIIIKQAQPVEESTIDNEDYDTSYPSRLGMASIINQAIENVNLQIQEANNVNSLEYLIASKHNQSTTLGKSYLNNVKINNATGENDYTSLSVWVSNLGLDIETAKTADLNVAISGLSGNESEAVKQGAIKELQKYVSMGNSSNEIKAIENQIISDPVFKNYVKSMQTQQTPKFQFVNKKTIIAQSENNQQVPTETLTQDMSNPLTSGKFESMDELKSTLIELGPKSEVYNRIFELVGKDNEDSAKSALSKFFQGAPAALCVLYDMLIKAGVASPVDEGIIGGLMEKHPEIFPEEENNVEASLSKNQVNGAYVLEAEGKTITIKNSWDIPFLASKLGWDGIGEAVDYVNSKVGQKTKVAGLFRKNYKNTVAAMNGLFIAPLPNESNKTIQKTASGGVGSTVNVVYDLAGPNERRYCPKLRNVISSFQCRYNCLDGLAIGDSQILCGEAIYRQAIMDKFSTEYLNKEGKLEGGYIRDRFEVENTTHEHPTLLKPGQRMQPINEDAWSTEKRLQELRRQEGKNRGYSETPGDPKGLYNFDQHEIVKGPQAPNLFGLSGRSKTAAFNLKQVKTADAASPRPEKLTIQLFDDFFMVKDVDVSGNIDIRVFHGDPSKGSVFSSEVAMLMHGKLAFSKHINDELRNKLETEIKKNLNTRQAFNLKKQKVAGPMTPAKVEAGTVCSKCSLPGKEGQAKCLQCGGKMNVQTMNDALSESGALPKSNIVAYVSNGVFKVTKGDVCAYGSSIKEALVKLSAEIAPDMQEPLDEEEANLTEYIQGTEEIRNDIHQQNQPINNLQPIKSPLMTKGKEEGHDESEEEGPHIDAKALDSFLATVQEKNQEDKQHIQDLAVNMHLGPDKRTQVF